jgi:hypothetical protein
MSATDDSVMLFMDDYRDIILPTINTNRNLQMFIGSGNGSGDMNFAVMIGGEKRNWMTFGAVPSVASISIHKPVVDPGNAFELKRYGDTDPRFEINNDGSLSYGNGSSPASWTMLYGGENRVDLGTDDFMVGDAFIDRKNVFVSTTNDTIDVTGLQSIELNFSSLDTVKALPGALSGQFLRITSEGSNNVVGGAGILLDGASSYWEPGTNEILVLEKRPGTLWQEVARSRPDVQSVNIAFSDQTETITISTISTPEHITNGGNNLFSLANNTGNITFAGDSLTIGAGGDGLYNVFYSLSSNGVNNDEVETMIQVNGVGTTSNLTAESSYSAANKRMTMACLGVLDLNEGDGIKLAIQNNSNTNNLEVNHCNIVLLRTLRKR